MRAVLLGTAAGGGVPQWNCRCPVCDLAWRGDPRVSRRTQFALAASADGERWVLIGAPPDLYAQIVATPDLEPRKLRGSPITAVVLLGAEIDQIGGLVTLRERHGFTLCAAIGTLRALAANPIFSVLDALAVGRRHLEPEAPVELAGLTLELIALGGKRALWQEDEGAVAPAYGVEITSGGSRILCLPNVLAPDDRLVSRMRRADVVLYDGTCFTDDELAARGVSHRTSRGMGHQPVSGEGGSLELLRRLGLARLVYVHINNTNPMLVAGSPEAEAVAAAGFELGFDGMELTA